MVKHPKNEFDNDKDHINGIENFWDTLNINYLNLKEEREILVTPKGMRI